MNKKSLLALTPVLTMLFGSLAFGQTGLTGLGGSTMLCVDRDGDGYGTGPLVGTETATGVTGIAVNTSVASAISSGAQTVTPASMTNIAVGMWLRVVDASGNPGSMEYVQVTSATGATFTATFSLSHSSLPVHITDLGCLGPDADDLDATVHTWTQLTVKYGGSGNTAVKNAFAALYTSSRGYSSAANPDYVQYNPAHIWYLAPASGTAQCTANRGSSTGCSGNDGTGVEDDPTHPFATWGAISAAVGTAAASASVAVVMADGFTDQLFLPSGKDAADPVILMGFPGELPVFTTAATQGPFIQGKSYITLDNMKFTATSGGSFGDTSYYLTSHNFHDIIFRHIDGNCGSQRGLCEGGVNQIAGMTQVTFEDSMWHDNQEHGLYIGCASLPCSNVTVQRNVFFNNGWTGLSGGFGGDSLHWNGVCYSGCVIRQNSFAWSETAAITLQSGFSNGLVESNVAFTDPINSGGGVSASLVIDDYKDNTNCDGGTGMGGDMVCIVNSASWSGGIATITVSNLGSGFDIFVGGYVYVYGFTGSFAGYNCSGTAGQGCPVTAINGSTGTISYAIANPGASGTPTCATNTSFGCVVASGTGDEANNLIENNTFVTTAYGLMSPGPPAVLVRNYCATCSNQALLVSGSLNGNIFRNNIAINYAADGAGNSSNANYPDSPFAFANSVQQSGINYATTTLFDHNVAYDLGCYGPACLSATGDFLVQPNTCGGLPSNKATYNYQGTALQGGCSNLTFSGGGGMTGNQYAAPGFFSVSTSLTLPTQFNLGLLNTSPAMATGSTASLPNYDVYGNSFGGTPSMGAIEIAPGSPPLPPPPTGTPTTLTMVSGNNQSASVSTQLSSPFVAQVTDSNGNPVSGVAVTFAVTSGGGTVVGGNGTPSTLQVTTNASGTASATLVLGSATGTDTVTASASGLTGSPLTFTATATAASSPPSPGNTPVPPGTWVTALTDGYTAQVVGWEHLIWVPTIHRAVMLGGYRDFNSEPNTGLVAYDFQANRWDVLDVLSPFHTDHHPEAGHPDGSFGFNPVTGLITYKCCYSGSSVAEDTSFTYTFDPIGQVGRNEQTSPMATYELSGAGDFDLSTNLLVAYDPNTIETWTYNSGPNTWTQESTTCSGTACYLNAPPGLNMATMDYDSANQLSYMFGGFNGSNFYNYLFTYNSSTKAWTQLNPTCPCPSPRAYAGFAYDSIHNVFLLFGGASATTNFSDTWIYDPTANAWTQLSPSASPSLTNGNAVPMGRLTFDPDDNVFLLAMNAASGNMYSGGGMNFFPTQMWFFRYSGTGPNAGNTPVSYAAPAGSLNKNPGAEQAAGNVWTAGWAQEPSVATDGISLFAAWAETGTPFAGDDSQFMHIFVKNASTGAFLGGAYNSISIDNGAAEKPSLAFAGSTLWEAHSEAAYSQAGASYLVAKQWNGSAWVGGPVGFMTASTYCCTAGISQISAIGSTPYLALIEDDRIVSPNEKYIYVASYNGSSWSALGGTKLNRTGKGTVAESVSIANDGTNPIVAWAEFTAAGGAYPPGIVATPPQIYVSQWNGSAWTSLGSSLNRQPTDWASSPSITYFQGAPNVCWDERSVAGINQLYCSRWNGTSWAPLGSGALNNNASTGWAFGPSTTTDQTNLYTSWVEQVSGQPGQVFVSKWNGTAWTSLGAARNVGPGSAQTMKLAFIGSTLGAAFSQLSFGTTGEVFAEQLSGSTWSLLNTSSPSQNPCDMNGDGVVNALDVTAAIDQALGTAACSTANLQGNGQCNVVDVQRVINATLGQACLTGP